MPNPLTLPVILAAQFVVPLSIAGTAVALPSISNDLGADSAGLHWAVDGFNIGFALFTVVWGAVSDRSGHVRTFRTGVAIAAAASAVSAVSSSFAVLDASRVTAGVGAAAVLTGSTAVLSRAYTGAARTKAFALFGTVNGLGLAAGPAVSGTLVGALGWRAVFAANALLLLAALIGTVWLPALPPVERTGQRLLDLTLLRNPRFVAMCLVPVAGAIGFVSLLTYLPNALSAMVDLSAGTSGLVMLTMTIPVLVAPIAVARTMRHRPRLSTMAVVYTSLGCLVVGDLGMLLLGTGGSVSAVLVPMVLIGLGFGLPIGLVDGAALAAVSPENAGTAAGLLNLFRIGSEAVFVALYARVLTELVLSSLGNSPDARAVAAGRGGHSSAYADAFATVSALLACGVALCAGAIAMLHLRGRQGSGAPSSTEARSPSGNRSALVPDDAPS